MGWVRRIALLSAVAAGAYVAVSAGMAAGMTRAVRIRPEDDPSAVGLAFSDVSFRSRDGELELAGWLVPPQGEQGALDPALSRWIVMVHGFGTNRANPAAGGLGLARDLSDRGFGLLMFDCADAEIRAATRVRSASTNVWTCWARSIFSSRAAWTEAGSACTVLRWALRSLS